MTKKKNVISKKRRNDSYGSPEADSNLSAIPPPDLSPWSMWKIKHYTGGQERKGKRGGREREALVNVEDKTLHRRTGEEGERRGEGERGLGQCGR